MPKNKANAVCDGKLEATMTFAGELSEILTTDSTKPAEQMPAAGPHARPELTNFDACPGAGALPSEQEMNGDADPGAG
jgi:hypothetical protein